MAFHVPQDRRIVSGDLATPPWSGNHGAFLLASPQPHGRRLLCIATGGLDWEHVSVSARQGNKTRIPTWEEMCFVKGQFWGPEDAVMQLHPPESSYVRTHPHVLHLWRPTGEARSIPLPPSALVGTVRGDDAEWLEFLPLALADGMTETQAREAFDRANALGGLVKAGPP